MDITASFGYWLRRRRKALDLTQELLAQRVGCAETTIRKIEADERRPSRQVAERLADQLALAPEERVAFLEAARGERSPERLAVATQPAGNPSAHTMHVPLPRGTLTFLFSDIEGSTTLWEQHGAAMERALARHDQIMRQTID